MAEQQSGETWRLKFDREESDEVDEVVMTGAYVHLEDLGDAYMLIVENAEQHIHLQVPHPKKRLAWVLERFTPTPSVPSTKENNR